MVSDLVKLELVTDMHMLLAKSFEDALRRAHAIEGRNAKATVLPDGLAWSLHMELAKTVEADMHMELAQTFSTGPVPAGHPARAVGPRAIHRGNPRRRPGRPEPVHHGAGVAAGSRPRPRTTRAD